MRTKFTLAMIGVALFGLQQLTRGQCPQFCDDSLFNTALGSDALANNTTGFYNTAIGFNALFFNTTGYYNTANGKRFVVRADEKLTAFLELESAVLGCG